MNASEVLLLAFLIGIVSGLRSFMGSTTTAWGAHLGWINLAGTRLAFMGTIWCVAFLSILEIVELVVDKLPGTPPRTKGPGLITRILFGALAGGTLAVAGIQNGIIGAILGAVGAIAGAFGGYKVRTGLVKALKVPDIVIALCEDAVAIAAGLFIVSRL